MCKSCPQTKLKEITIVADHLLYSHLTTKGEEMKITKTSVKQEIAHHLNVPGDFRDDDLISIAILYLLKTLTTKVEDKP